MRCAFNDRDNFVILSDPTDISGLTVMTDLITRSLLTKHLPVLVSFGETPRGQLFPVKPWDLTLQVSRIFQPKKVMLINSHGGFMDKQGKVGEIALILLLLLILLSVDHSN